MFKIERVWRSPVLQRNTYLAKRRKYDVFDEIRVWKAEHKNLMHDNVHKIPVGLRIKAIPVHSIPLLLVTPKSTIWKPIHPIRNHP